MVATDKHNLDGLQVPKPTPLEFIEMLEADKSMLANEDDLNIVMDESGDIADRRIINMCIVTPTGAFYYVPVTDNSKDESQPAQMLFESMMKRVYIRTMRIVKY